MKITKDIVLEALSVIIDPDLGKNIVELGFVQNLMIEGAKISFDLVLTTPACPVKDLFKAQCKEALIALDGVKEVDVRMSAQTRGAPNDKRDVLPTVKNVIAVASGKGGVAKSTTAVNLAVALAEKGAKVGLLDADIYGPSIPTMIELDVEPGGGADNRLVPAQGLGLKLISMGYFLPPKKAAILRGPMVSGYITQFLTNVEWGELDYLIIDYPPGTGDVQLTLSQQAAVTAAVLCTTPQDIALVDVEKAVAMFETTKVPVLGVVETMSYFICDQCDKKHSIFGQGGGEQVAQEVGVPLLGKIPIDPRVVLSGDGGKPIVMLEPNSPAAQAYQDVAGKVAARLSMLNLGHDGSLDSFSVLWDGSTQTPKEKPQAASQMSDLAIQAIYQVDKETLGIDWNDGARRFYALSELRKHCPCASCIDEWTREPLLDPKTVADDLSATRVDSVGRYALRVSFSDGHDTGMYTFNMLRELGKET